MATNTETAEKRIDNAVEHLNFGKKTSLRVTWEAWEFTIVGPHQVEVTNASYGFLKDDHSYVVGVGERDGVVVPVECGCPADRYNENYDCKHKVALATVGGPTVLNAAVNYESPSDYDDTPEATTAADKLRADGGCECDSDDFPCWECVRTDRRELPE
ncbi:hypothetical protein [Halorientalis marina]|uniref:hypothetical protein n=1 Tax=Halorientalis marina TaxID=2931976 RepID=UPI001FF4D252|nr:hypothetical protein [Halorientalis marina]